MTYGRNVTVNFIIKTAVLKINFMSYLAVYHVVKIKVLAILIDNFWIVDNNHTIIIKNSVA